MINKPWYGRGIDLEDCYKRADRMSKPDGSQHSGILCDNKDLRRIVFLVSQVRDLKEQLERHIQHYKDGIEQVKSRHPDLFQKKGR